MPIISFGGDLITWPPSVGWSAFFIRTTVARLLGTLLIFIICGCAANTMPPTVDEDRGLTEKTDLALPPPSKGPIDAKVTLTVFEEYQ